MEENFDETLKRLILKYNENLSSVSVPLNFEQVCQKYRINSELGLKFLVLSSLDPIISKFPDRERFEAAVSNGVFSSRQRFGANYERKKEETDWEKIRRKINISAKEFKANGINSSVEALFKNPIYSRWWKALHLPILKEYGFFDDKITEILMNHRIGEWIKEEYNRAMFPYDTKYWIRELRRTSKCLR